MLNAKLIVKTGEIKALAEELLHSRTLPPFLLEEDKYKRFVVELKEEHERIGIAYGVAPHGEGAFHLHVLHVKKEYRTHTSVVYLLSFVLESVMIAGVKKAVWRYTMKEGERDLRPNILSGIPFCQVGKIVNSKHIKIKSANLERIKRNSRFYRPHICAERGYTVLPWPECGENLKAKIREREGHDQQDKNYLSPFIEKEDSRSIPDEQTSLVLVRNDGNNTLKPMGWIICKKVCDNEVDIQCFYMYPEERGRMMGHSFSSYAIDVIMSSYEYFGFGVATGNHQMEKFVQNWLNPVIDYSFFRCNLHMDLQKPDYTLIRTN